jgi:hypothetical protein
MFTGQVDVISNQATWQSKVCELVDEDDGTTTDLSNPALTVDIVVTIKSVADHRCIYATASVANGKVTIPGPGFQWQFEVSDLTNLCAGTYGLGAKVTINGFVTDLIDGTITVIQGN